MTRPCFVIVDREHAGTISTRKLVVETAKMNVITAYSGAEAVETVARFPKVDGAVLSIDVGDMPCAEVVRQMKAITPGLPVVVVGRLFEQQCEGADVVLESFRPQVLLDVLRKLEPERVAVIEQHEQALIETEGE